VRTWEAAKPLLTEAAARTGDAAFIITSSVSAVNSDNPSSYGAMKAAVPFIEQYDPADDH
jgi:3-oxoacyl-[acyl-carrier protein] reductase